MIKYNNNTINDWNFGDDNIIKVYRHGAVCYYKITSGDTPTPVQEPCFAVVDNISQYQETEFEDVFNKADGKWYKLNNLDEYEEYGVYGSGRDITHYDGKLTIDDGYEYQYSGGSWVNVGEVSGSTATLPDVPFSVNYNANNYDANTKTLAKTSGQLVDTDAVITAGTPTVNDGYLTIASGTRATISGYQTYFNRTNNNPNLTIISKQRTDGNNCHMFANRDSDYNWMYRCYATYLTLHGVSETGGVAVTTQPVIESVRVNSSRNINYNNYTNNTSSSSSTFSYGGENTGNFALFQGYATSTGENFVGDFYWVYMSQNTLTDDQVQQVIEYNEGGGEPEYPMYYTVKQDPPNNVSFSSMTEAEEYECPWVGMTADINNTDYIFDVNYLWVTKYELVEVSGAYICDEGNKYKKMEEKIRNVDDTWSSQIPPVYEKGELIESASTDCPTYTQYEYIRTQNAETIYYDFVTNFKPTTANTLEVKVEFVDRSIDWGHIVSWYDTISSDAFSFQTVTSSYQAIVRTGGNNGIFNRPTIGANNPTVYTLPLSAQSGTYSTNGGVSQTIQYNYSTMTLPADIGMCFFGRGTISREKAAVAKMYYVKVYDENGNLVKHYVPSDNNGAPCFYEIVDGEYIMDTYTGSNHGTLTLGPEV